MLACFAYSLADRLGYPIEIGYLPIHDTLFALTHDGRTEYLQSAPLYRTNKNLDFRGSYIECYELVVVNDVAYLE